MEVRKLAPGSAALAAAATAEVLVNEKRRGTAVLVSQSYCLTASHVVKGQDYPDKSIRLRFPADGTEVEAMIALRHDHIDLLVLRLLTPTPHILPEPVQIWQDERLPENVQVYGYPLAERQSQGVWRTFTIAGPTADGLQQLSWSEGVGTFVGHSGGPVLDAESHRLVGILLAGSEEGRFDRFVPISSIGASWAELPRRWRYGGDAAESHFRRRAYGQRSGALGGDLFRGRESALRAISHWLASSPPGRPLVILGQPGSGKSAVLGRAALRFESTAIRGLVYHCRGASISDFAGTVSRFLDIETDGSDTDRMIRAVHKNSTGPFVIMIDALDEASSTSDAYLIADTLSELSRLPETYVVVATRALASRNRLGPGTILNRLLVFDETAANLIDLDAAPYRDRNAIEAFVSAGLGQLHTSNPGPIGCAWEVYRTRDDLRDSLAKVIARRADPNFLVASITTMTLSNQEKVLDPTSTTFDDTLIPSSVGEALDKYFASLESTARERSVSLLTSLAYARGAGISDNRWVDFAREIGYTISQSDIDWLRSSPGADYLLQFDTEDDEACTRLFHAALVDQLRAGRSPSEEKRLYYLLALRVEEEGGWGTADRYTCTYMADHALASGNLHKLIREVSYLAAAEIINLQSALHSLGYADSPPIGQLILQAGSALNDVSGAERLWYLACAATHAGQTELRDSLLHESTLALLPDWAHAVGGGYQKLSGHHGPVRAIAFGRFGLDEVVASGGDDETIRIWNRHGHLLVRPLIGHRGSITALAFGKLEGEHLIVSGGLDRTVRVWDQDGLLAAVFRGHTGKITALRITEFAGQSAIISVAPGHEVIVWNAEGKVLRREHILHRHVAIASTDAGDVLLGLGFSSLAVLSLQDLTLTTVKVRRAPKSVVTYGQLGTAAAIVYSLYDGSLVVCRLDGSEALLPLTGQDAASTSVVLGKLEGLDVIAATSGGKDLLIWDYRGRLVSQPWGGHMATAGVTQIGSIRGQAAIACAGPDGSLRIWDGRSALSRGRSNARDPIVALSVGRLDDEVSIVTASSAGIEIWDDAGRLREHVNLPADVHRPEDVTIVNTRFFSGVVFRDGDDIVRMWTHSECRDLHEAAAPIRAMAVSDFGGTTVAIALVDTAGSASIWTMHDDQIVQPHIPKKESVTTVQFALFDDRRVLLVLSGRRTHVWDVEGGDWSQHLPRLAAGVSVTCACVAPIDGADVVIIGCSDGRVRMWRNGTTFWVATRERHASAVKDVCTVGGTGAYPLIASVAGDSTIRVWHDLFNCEVLPLVESGQMLAVFEGLVVIGMGPALSMLCRNPSAPTSVAIAQWQSGDIEFDGESASLDSDIPDVGQTSTPPMERSMRNPGGVDSRKMSGALRAFHEGRFEETVEEALRNAGNTSTGFAIAADAAYASGEPAVMDKAVAALRRLPTPVSQPLMGKLFFLGLEVDDYSAVEQALIQIVTAPVGAGLGAIEMLDVDPTREWTIYRQTAKHFFTRPRDSNSLFARHFPVMVASRILMLARRLSSSSPDTVNEVLDSLLEEYWSVFSEAVEVELRTALEGYPQAERPRLRGYQLVSVYEVLSAVWPAPAEFERLLEGIVLKALSVPLERTRHGFAETAELSALGVRVARQLDFGLLHQIAALPSGRGT
mgnify:FL=1|nr:trypsin-like peptidase domain-containing protein [Pseudonocardia sp.]